MSFRWNILESNAGGEGGTPTDGLAAVDSAIADTAFALRTHPHIPLLNWVFARGHFVRSAMLDVSTSREKHQREFSA